MSGGLRGHRQPLPMGVADQGDRVVGIRVHTDPGLLASLV